MESNIRTGRVSSIDYKRGTYEVVYNDRGQSVTVTVNAVSNGEYKMPNIGQMVSVTHNSNGTTAASSFGTVWNRSNTPAEGFKGLWRKEYGSKAGDAYSRYDENTGVYQLFIPQRIERISNGEIYDEAKNGAATFAAKKQVQIKSAESSASIQAKTSVGINAGDDITAEAGKNIILEAGGTVSLSGDELKISIHGAEIAIDKTGGITISSPTSITLKAPSIQEIEG